MDDAKGYTGTVTVAVKVQVESNNKIQNLVADLKFANGKLMEVGKPRPGERGEITLVFS